MPKNLYIDTNILIYLLENHERYSEAVASELQKFTATPDARLVTSSITVTEFLSGTDSSSIDTLRQVPRLTFVALDEQLAAEAGALKRNNGLTIGDAIHLATALSTKAEALFTNDKQFTKIATKHIKVIHPTTTLS